MLLQAKLNIQGRVQGVFYRSEAQKKAEQLGLSGWVKNEKDGSVSVCVQGAERQIHSFINWAHEGPERADVETMEVQLALDPRDLYKDFKIVD